MWSGTCLVINSGEISKRWPSFYKNKGIQYSLLIGFLSRKKNQIKYNSNIRKKKTQQGKHDGTEVQGMFRLCHGCPCPYRTRSCLKRQGNNTKVENHRKVLERRPIWKDSVLVNLWWHQIITESNALRTRRPGGHGHIVQSTCHTWKKNC